MCARTLLVVLAAGLALPCPAAAEARSVSFGAKWLRLLEAEDARAATREQLDILLRGLEERDVELQRIAVRALGRLERPDLVPAIAAVLSAGEAAVRAEAANALAQAVWEREGQVAKAPLLARLAMEADPLVQGALCAALGRLSLGRADDLHEVGAALLETGWPKVGGSRSPASPAVLLGVLRGVESFVRVNRRTIAMPAELSAALRATALPAPAAGAAAGAGDAAWARARQLAAAAIAHGGLADTAYLDAALRDADEEIRRLAVQAVALSGDAHEAVLGRAAADPFWRVRLQALMGMHRQRRGECGLALTAAGDPHPHVALQGLQLAGVACAGHARAVALLDDELRGRYGERPDESACGTPDPRRWHRAARALTSLAQLDRDRADAWTPCAARDPAWQVRAAAAGVAHAGGRADLLDRLAEDRDDNVVDAVVAATGSARYARAALARGDYQLLLTAAGALKGARPEAALAEDLVGALERITAHRRETSRDARVALLDRLAEQGSAALTDRVRPLVGDFDPEVAARAATLVSAWTGKDVLPEPQRRARLPLPWAGELVALADRRVTLVFAGDRQVLIRPIAAEAPLNAWRFVRLSREGYYTGLTLHRLVPNFILQGGSPAANEHAGDALHSRDEVGGRSNTRGAIGLSTRGRDTGDAQFYVNLVDNPRLDHSYTVFAQIESGMDVIDALLEGEVIEAVAVQ
jgi:cyclophilin family peptidyl-prolyl cis-trans isomerase/HEAT repeat protein